MIFTGPITKTEIRTLPQRARAVAVMHAELAHHETPERERADLRYDIRRETDRINALRRYYGLPEQWTEQDEEIINAMIARHEATQALGGPSNAQVCL